MILSVSRRTAIPHYDSDWFLRRLKEGWLLVKNPMNPHQISRIELSPETIDCIVFWTKNPLPMMEYLGELTDIPILCGHIGPEDRITTRKLSSLRDGQSVR